MRPKQGSEGTACQSDLNLQTAGAGEVFQKETMQSQYLLARCPWCERFRPEAHVLLSQYM